MSSFYLAACESQANRGRLHWTMGTTLTTLYALKAPYIITTCLVRAVHSPC